MNDAMNGAMNYVMNDAKHDAVDMVMITCDALYEETEQLRGTVRAFWGLSLIHI